ncbi:hypothetical protein NPIL_202661 [Nephila pilipes]|uniref:Uncharacterized protein n=1 Tax=Nephila pilipes TaxID=299642 RepID=A0A8X6URQ5_NEPPI|nr:hypothetical protein NPIL_202661 [Nephila pilipes]
MDRARAPGFILRTLPAEERAKRRKERGPFIIQREKLLLGRLQESALCAEPPPAIEKPRRNTRTLNTYATKVQKKREGLHE